MYGNRGSGRYNSQQGGSLLGNAGNIMMANQMTGMANIQLLSQTSGQRERTGLYPMNRSLGMQEMQQPGVYGVSERRSMPLHGLDPVLDIVVIAINSL